MAAQPYVSVASFLKERGLEHLAPALSALTLEELVERLTESRPKVLEALRSLGVEQLADRQKIANGLSKALREGAIHDPRADRDAAEQLRRLALDGSMSQHDGFDLASAIMSPPPDVHLAPSSGGAPIALSKRAADLCGMLCDLAEITSDGAAVPLPCERATCVRAVALLEDLADGRRAECGPLDADDALALADAAHFLDADALAEVASARLATLVAQCDSAEEVCARFGVDCDFTPEERAAALLEPPWTPHMTTSPAVAPQHSGEMAAAGRLPGDAVEKVLQRCSPPVLLWLKGASCSWRDRIRQLLCDHEWAVRHALPANWLEGARALTTSAQPSRPEDGSAAQLHFADILSTAELDLSRLSGGIGALQATGIAVVIALSPVLRSLDLTYGRISYEGAAIIGRAVEANPALENLHLECNTIGPAGGEAIAKALRSNGKLRSLTLHNNNIGPAGAMAIARALETNVALARLDLDDNEIGPQAAVAIGRALSVNTALCQLNLYGNNINDEGAVAVGDALRINRTISSLNLDWNQVGVKGASAVFAALEGNAVVRSLSVDHNLVSPESSAAIARVISRNSTLTVLNLSNNALLEAGAKTICRALAANTALTQLGLGGNKIGPEGAVAVSSALKLNSTLRQLDLSGNKISGQVFAFEKWGNGSYDASGVTAVAEALGINSALTSLDLSGNSLCGLDRAGRGTYTTEGIDTIRQALGMNAALTTLNLRSNNLDAAALQAMRDAAAQRSLVIEL